MKALCCAAVLLGACNYPKLDPVGTSDSGPSRDSTSIDGSGSGSGGTGIDAGAVAFYHLNEGSGLPVADASGAGNNATIMGGQFNWVAGWAGGGLSVNGSGGHPSAPASP